MYAQVLTLVSHTLLQKYINQMDSLSIHHQDFHSKTFTDAQSTSVLPPITQFLRAILSHSLKVVKWRLISSLQLLWNQTNCNLKDKQHAVLFSIYAS